MANTTLEQLLLPGTPRSVRERYLTLAERAQTADFGPLEEDFVVLDTETTGLSFKNCKLIEIAAARISGREVVGRFQTFVNPGAPIPPEIVALTSITDLNVADAPMPREAVAQLADFVGGSPVLAHNATFDRTFVEAVPGGRDVSDLWLDTLALSRIALPRLGSHRLADMAQAFGCEAVTHRAMADVDALCGMWRILLLALSDLPQGLLARLAGMHEDVDWPFRTILGYLADGQEPQPFSLKACRYQLAAEADVKQREDAAEKPCLFAPTPDAIRDAFAADGLVSAMYDTYDPRPDQVQMALEVTDALATGTHRSIEAGTGVGKSMAYLLPSVLYAQRNNVTVGVATKTNALTDQLVSHELPALDRALPGGVTFTSLKGYDHYPCLHRMERAVASELPLHLVEGVGKSTRTIEAEMLTSLAVTYAYCCQSPEGDIDALGIRWRFVPREMLTTTPAECLRTKCPFFPAECLVHGARRRAASSDVVVTNHSLLLRDVDMDGKILPPVRHWIVDEAHAFEAEARRQWAREVGGEATRDAFELLGGTKTGAIHQAMTQTTQVEGATLIQRLLTKAAAASSRAQVSTADLFLAVHELTGVAGHSGGYDNVQLWIDDAVRRSPQWQAVEEVGELAVRRLDEACKDVREAAEAIAQVAPQVAADLTESGRFLTSLLDGLRLILAGEDASYVYSAQLSHRKRDLGTEKLLAQKIDVGADLAASWLPQTMSVCFTSATIAVGKSFEHFDHAMGLDLLPRQAHRDVSLSSSFDYDSNMSVIVARDMPEPNNPAYVDALTDLLYDVHVAMGGSVLTLFTNRRDMERVHEALRPRMAAVGLDVLMQERGASPRRLRESFMADKSRSLLALKSFWEGFDASGDTLRCVVITKLPFASPQDPLVRERERRDDRAWWHHSLPEAVISVKQAAGRLIRSSTDTGVLVMADARLVSKRYGKQFMSSLPNPNYVALERANVSRYLEAWRSGHEA